MQKFWNWVSNETGGERTLYLNGVIAEETWWGDEVTPKMFKEELYADSGDITVWLHSPGGDVFAAAQIYNMLRDYPGHVTVKIDGLAASAASVVAMAGDEVYISPVGVIMIHNPSTISWGDSEEMLRAKAMLDEIKEAIINAYEAKTKLSRAKLSHMMDDESWLNAHKAVEMGFADKVMFMGEDNTQDNTTGVIFSRMAVTNSLINKLPRQSAPPKAGTPIESLEKRLSLISH